MTQDTSNYVYLCMTANGWGRAPSDAAALAACRGHMGSGHVQRHGYVMYRVHPEFSIDPVDGTIRTPKGHPAIRLRDARAGLRKRA